jgi:folate-binding protein YgfZ
MNLADPLRPLHEQADAEFQPYGDLEIVSTFGEPAAEYAALHKGCGLMDLPQLGVVRATGKDRLAFLNNLVTTGLVDRETKQPLAAGQARAGYLLNLKGRVAAALQVVELGDQTLLVLPRFQAEMVRAALDLYLFAEDVQLTVADDLHTIALHGPAAAAMLADAADGDVPTLDGQSCGGVSISGVAATVFRDDVAGEAGLHLLVPTSSAGQVWGHLESVGGSPDPQRPHMKRLRPVGWAAFNARRIERGRVLPGVDYELVAPPRPGKGKEPPADAPRGVLPAELPRFEEHVSVTKGCYLGQEVVARMHARNVVAKQIVGLKIDDDALPMAGVAVTDENDAAVGLVTSSTVSPILSRAAIALAYLKRPHFEVGTRLKVAAEGAIRGCEVVATPFA